jgi:hypothetical protein
MGDICISMYHLQLISLRNNKKTERRHLNFASNMVYWLQNNVTRFHFRNPKDEDFLCIECRNKSEVTVNSELVMSRY